MARLFKKLFSSTSDLLNKEYPENVGHDFQVEVNKTFEATGEEHLHEIKLTVTKDPASSKVKFVAEPKTVINNLEITGKISNDEKFEGTFIRSKLADGKVKVSFKETFEGALNNYAGEFGAEFVDKHVSANGTVNFSGKNLLQTIKAKASFVYEENDIAVGAELVAKKAGDDLILESTTIRTEQTGTNYAASFEAVFAEKNTLTIGYHQKVNDHLHSATDFKLSNLENGGLGAVARVGFIDQIDTTSTLRTKLSVSNQKSQRFGLVYQKTYDNNFKLSLGADLNVNQLLGGNVAKEDNHKFGLTLSLD